MALKVIPSEYAETASALIMRSLAHYRAASAPLALTIGGRGSSGRLHASFRLPGRIQRESPLAEHDAIVRAVAVAEDFSLARLTQTTETILPDERLFEAMWKTELRQSSDTWPRRLDAWKRLHDIRIKARFPWRFALLGFIEARNSIAHGLGNLTRKQLGNRAKTEELLNEAGITVQGNALILNADHVICCAQVMTVFVDWLDVSAAMRIRDFRL